VWNRMLLWLDDRTGYKDTVSLFRRRVLPDGPGWAKTTASCLLWMFVVELVTGLLLMTAYSPSTTSAWPSVFFIEQTPAGGFIRGLHYFGGQALIVLFAVHAVRVLLTASYRNSRDLVWITGLVLIPLILLWPVTGNPLAGTQKGYAQIEVESNIIASTPVAGPAIQRILIGGDQVGNLTLTHLYSLHVALLPLIVGCLVAFHVFLVYRHASYATDATGHQAQAAPYWPHQSVRNLTAFALVFAAVAWLAYRYGAPLEAPADPDTHHIPRPEWYFLSLFELRRYFSGQWEFVATMVIPAAIMLLLLIVPLIDMVCWRWLSMALRCLIVISGIGAWAALTWTSLERDRTDAEYQTSRQQEVELAARARILADRGIPPTGAITLLRGDPKIQGPKLFAEHCASCHSHADESGNGIVCAEPTAANLYGIASRRWVADILDPEKFASEQLFGNTAFSESEMTTGVTDYLEEENVVKLVAALSAEATLTSQKADDERDADLIAEGVDFIKDDSEGCAMCHRFHDAGELGEAPDLTGYGSREWLIDFIGDPTQERFYRDTNDRMPVFAEHPDDSDKNLLDRQRIELLVDWLRGDWYEPNEADKD
jgi:ubiquinol-cytochrome c reductase cytochrome b subunit